MTSDAPGHHTLIVSLTRETGAEIPLVPEIKKKKTKKKSSEKSDLQKGFN